jgi:hypothetical protein
MEGSMGRIASPDTGEQKNNVYRAGNFIIEQRNESLNSQQTVFE